MYLDSGGVHNSDLIIYSLILLDLIVIKIIFDLNYIYVVNFHKLKNIRATSFILLSNDLHTKFFNSIMLVNNYF